MFVSLAFYIVSSFLIYFDCKRYIVPNELVGVLLLFVVLFGLINGTLNFHGFIVAFGLLMFFFLLYLLKFGYVGGGDIKYLLVVSIYLEPLGFAYFLVICGFVQILFLVFYKRIKKRRFAPMVPAMVLSVLIYEILSYLNLGV